MSLSEFTQPLDEKPPVVPKEEICIAIMGATGSGKSTFMNLVSGSNSFVVGNGLRSCTSQVEITKASIDGRAVSLIDTPGFDDTNVSDTDLLKMIALTFSTIYRQGYKLTGVIYMHRISDFRVGGTARRNFNMFCHFCGDENLKNVVLVTNMWSLVGDQAVGEAREQELRTDPDLFQPVLAGGGVMIRHDDTLESSQAILRQIMAHPPCVLRIQRELVDEGKDISETSAGKELDKELAELTEKQNAELEEIQAEMSTALVTKDTQTEQELAEARDELMKNMMMVEDDRNRISKEYQEQNKKVNDEIRLLELKLRDERSASGRKVEELKLRKLKEAVAQDHADKEELRELKMRLAGLQDRQSMASRAEAPLEYLIRGVNWVLNAMSTPQSAPHYDHLPRQRSQYRDHARRSHGLHPRSQLSPPSSPRTQPYPSPPPSQHHQQDPQQQY